MKKAIIIATALLHTLKAQQTLGAVQNELNLGTVDETQMEEYDTCVISDDCRLWFQVCSDGYCKHKGIMPMYAPEFVGLFVLSALVGLANVSGIGGGGITVPLVGLCWGFQTK